MVKFGKQEISALDLRPKIKNRVMTARNGIQTNLLSLNATRTVDEEERIRGAVEAAAVLVERVKLYF